MKTSPRMMIWCVLLAGIARVEAGQSEPRLQTLASQDVRVRLYTARPPATILVRAVEGEIHWRLCTNCAEKSGHEVSLGSEAESGGSELYVTGHYELRPGSGPVFAGSYPLHIERRNGRALVIVTMPLEEYVAAVLSAESGDFENVESRKAMAVVARTYSMRFLGQHEAEGFDFCDTTHCQVFGWKGANAAVRAAVNATRGEVLRFEGKLAQTFYHQSCGGMTAAAQEAWPSVKEPYLTAHADAYCAARGVLKWESAIRVADLDRALRAAGLEVPAEWKTIEVVLRSESGRAQRLKLAGGTGGEARVSASTFRFAVDRELGWQKIRSDLYDVRSAGEQIVFSGRGSGHGVGLCQAGAEEMARQGKSYLEILNFYYPGTQIRAEEKINWQSRSGERVEILSTQPDMDSMLLPVAERILKEDEAAIGWKANGSVRLQIYASLDAYRDTTGQPGWVAGATRGHTIRLQPLAELRKRAIVESTLRHEIFHVLVEEKARTGTPLWFREGIVLYLANLNGCPSGAQCIAPLRENLAANAADAGGGMTDEQIEAVLLQPRNRDEVREAYAVAQKRVSTLVQERGKETVLGWLAGGIPGDVRRSSSGSGAAPHN